MHQYQRAGASGATTGNVVRVGERAGEQRVPFTVAPSITTVAPAAGIAGTPVTITGLNFRDHSGTGTSRSTGRRRRRPAGRTEHRGAGPRRPTGNVVVTVGGQPSNGATFTVTPPAKPHEPLARRWVQPGRRSRSAERTSADAGHEHGDVQRDDGCADDLERDEHRRAGSGGATTGNVVVTVGGRSNGLPFTVPPSLQVPLRR